MTMNKKQRMKNAQHLRCVMANVEHGLVEWYAITVQYKTYKETVHTAGAPKRPAGV